MTDDDFTLQLAHPGRWDWRIKVEANNPRTGHNLSRIFTTFTRRGAFRAARRHIRYWRKEWNVRWEPIR